MTAVVLTPEPENIALAAAALRQGEVVAMPTETVYGLAGRVYDEHALARIFSTKERPTFDPLICHVAEKTSGRWLDYLAEQRLVDVGRLSDVARQRVEWLTERFWPGPLTLVLPKQPAVPDLATSGLQTVAVRSPQHEVAQALLKAVGEPLAAPSANRFGRISPTSTADVLAELGDRIPLILEGGPCRIGIESTVLLVEPQGHLQQLRPGQVTPAAIEAIAQATVEVGRLEKTAEGTPLPAPGLMASHYAPRKPLRLLRAPWMRLTATQRQELLRALPTDGGLGMLLTAGDPLPAAEEIRQAARRATGRDLVVQAISLSAKGDVEEVARRLFSGLRALDDHPDVASLWAEPVLEEEGLGYAVNDRLRRASHG